MSPPRPSTSPSASCSPIRSASSSAMPQRPIPVSAFTCTPSGERAAARRRAYPSTDVTVTSTPSASLSWPGTSGPMTSTGTSPSSSRRARASSHVATHSRAAPEASAVRPTAAAPWP